MKDSFKLFALGDSAITFELGNMIREDWNNKVLAMQQWVREHPFEGYRDSIVAYSSLTVFYDPVLVRRKYPSFSIAFEFVKTELLRAWQESSWLISRNEDPIPIPVCYEGEMAKDLKDLAAGKRMSVGQIVQLHISRVYRVYMIGFLPGFAYMGEISDELAVSRKPRPVPVMAGSVGITGLQTGIYPLNSPGGWHIIGRTPLKTFVPEASLPIRLQTGDRVKFYPISQEEFGRISLL